MQSSWNQRTRSAAASTQKSQFLFASSDGEREAQQPGVLQPRDVLLDMGVGAHEGVEGDGVARLVGVEAPVAELERGEQALLGARDGAARAGR